MERINIERDFQKQSMELKVISMGDIKVPSSRVRLSSDIDDSFIYSIQTNGLLVPIIVAPSSAENEYILVHGARRYKAMAMLGEREISCIVVENIAPDDILFKELVYNIGERYTIAELNHLGGIAEKHKKVSSPSQLDNLLGLKEGNYLKLKAVLEYGMEEDDLVNDINNMLTSRTSDPNELIEKVYKKMERIKKKKEKEEQEGQQEEDEQDDGVNERLAGDDQDVCPTQEPEPSPEMRNYIVTKFGYACACGCGIKGEQYADILRAYTIKKPIFGGEFTEDNFVAICPNCNAMIVRYGLDRLSDYNRNLPYFSEIAKYGEQIKTDIQASGKSPNFFVDYFKKVL